MQLSRGIAWLNFNLHTQKIMVNENVNGLNFRFHEKNLVCSALEYMQQTNKADNIFKAMNSGGLRVNP